MSAQSIPVISKDQHELDLPMCVIERSGTLLQMINDLGIQLDSDEPMEIERIALQCTEQSLKKIIEICEFYHNNPKPQDDETDDAKAVYQQKIEAYLRQVHEDVKDYNWVMILDTDYLEIKFLFDILCCHVAETMRGKTTEELREMYDIENDFSQEDLEYIENSGKFSDI